MMSRDGFKNRSVASPGRPGGGSGGGLDMAGPSSARLGARQTDGVIHRALNGCAPDALIGVVSVAVEWGRIVLHIMLLFAAKQKCYC